MDPNECLKQIGEQLMYTGGEYDKAIELIEALTDWLNKDGFHPDENLNAYDWDAVLVGAYWFCCNYHGGQGSDEYRLLSMIACMFQPGMTSGPEPDSSEEMVYQDLERLFIEKHGPLLDEEDTEDDE